MLVSSVFLGDACQGMGGVYSAFHFHRFRGNVRPGQVPSVLLERDRVHFHDDPGSGLHRGKKVDEPADFAAYLDERGRGPGESNGIMVGSWRIWWERNWRRL